MPRRPSTPQPSSVPPATPKVLKISVPDDDDWYAFCAALLQAGQVQWWWQGDRNRRLEKGDQSLPWFKTWDQWKKALLQVGRLVWEDQHGPVRKAGRENKFFQFWRAFYEELKRSRYTYREGDTIPRFKGRAITQGEIGRMMRKADPTLSAKTCEKYARAIHIIVTNRNLSSLPKSDEVFLNKYVRPALRNIRA